MLNLYFDHTTLQLRFSFRLDWNLVGHIAIRTAVQSVAPLKSFT